MKEKNIIFLLVIMVLGVVAVTSASAFTQEQTQIVSTTFFDEAINSECSSILLQVSENESVSSFRRDEADPAKIFIEEGNWDNVSYVKQYKTTDGEFFQALITEDGYVIGVGGGTDGEYNKQIEEIASNMVKSGDISKDISKIESILKGYKKGHFIIKAPDGTYKVVWPNGVFDGKLKPGQYICVPNLQKYSFKGNFTGSDPVSESIKIAGKDIFGIDRRDIVTYDYKTNSSGTYLDVYACNDDGSIKGSSTGGLYDDIDYMGNVTLGKDLPQIPDKVHLGTYKFKDQDFFAWFWDAIHKK
ncbi:MAG: hypothetical protein HUK28_06450 [Methanobrevibacter sp.]|nr:hypothetical protein [Methanobrevibacter sp.]